MCSVIYWLIQMFKLILLLMLLCVYSTIHLLQYWLGSQTQAQTLEAGDHVYPFVIPLTTAGELPSSFEGRKGYVRYTLLGQIARPWKADETIVLPFTVINHLDLNVFPDVVVRHQCVFNGIRCKLNSRWLCSRLCVECHVMNKEQNYRRGCVWFYDEV